MRKRVNKIWPYAITIVLLISSSACHQVLAAASPTTTTKTYQDYGLGFRIEYPANLILRNGSDNITLYNPQNDSSNFFRSAVIVDTWIKSMGISGIFTPPTLDTLARQIDLGVSANAIITNNTKLAIDNTSAYLIQANSIRHGMTLYESLHLILKGDIVYLMVFSALDQQKFLQTEEKMVQSFRFI